MYLSLKMPTPVKENKKRYEQHRSMFYSYCLMSIGVNPDANQGLIEELMEENGYAIGTSDDGTVISFGKKRTEPNDIGEGYDILASADLEYLDYEARHIRAKERIAAYQATSAFQYGKLLGDLEYLDLFDYPQEGDLFNDKCVCFFLDDDAHQIIAYGYTNDGDTRIVSGSKHRILYVDNQNGHIFTQEDIDNYMNLQKRFGLPQRFFSTVTVKYTKDNEKQPSLVYEGVDYPSWYMHDCNGLVLQTDIILPE